MFAVDNILEQVVTSGLSADFTNAYENWQAETESLLAQAGGLKVPEVGQMIMGGHLGSHDEHLGHILSDMQYMQVRHPGLQW